MIELCQRCCRLIWPGQGTPGGGQRLCATCHAARIERCEDLKNAVGALFLAGVCTLFLLVDLPEPSDEPPPRQLEFIFGDDPRLLAHKGNIHTVDIGGRQMHVIMRAPASQAVKEPGRSEDFWVTAGMAVVYGLWGCYCLILYFRSFLMPP